MARDQSRLFLDALNAPGLSIEDDIQVIAQFLRQYLQANDPIRSEQRRKALRRSIGKRPSDKSKQRKRRKKRQTSPPSNDDFSDHPPSDTAQPGDDAGPQFFGPHPNDPTNLPTRPSPISQTSNHGSGHQDEDGLLPFTLDQIHLRISDSTTEPSFADTVNALIALPALQPLSATPRFKALIEKFVNALFSPASYLRVVESMQNILQISGLGDRGERSLGQDIHIEPKSRGTNPEPLCLKGLKDAWRQAMATEQLQDQHWARVKHLVLSIKSYSHWLTLLELLPRPDCEDGDFVRRLAETAKEEERTRMQSRGRSWKPSSETRYLQLAVAQHLGLPGGEKQWRDFEAHAHPAHVLHRHYGLLAIVSYKTLFKEIGEPMLQTAFSELLHRHPSLEIVAQALYRLYIEPLLGPGTLERPTFPDFMEIKGEGQLITTCKANDDGFIGIITSPRPETLDKNTEARSNSPFPSIEMSSQRSSSPDPSAANAQEIDDEINNPIEEVGQKVSGHSARRKTPTFTTPFTPAMAKSPGNNQLPTPGRSGASEPVDGHDAYYLDTPIAHGRKRRATTLPSPAVDDDDEARAGSRQPQTKRRARLEQSSMSPSPLSRLSTLPSLRTTNKA